jgi:hypothetical protein
MKTNLTDAAPALLAALKKTTKIVEEQLEDIIESNCAQGADGQYDPSTLSSDCKPVVKRLTKALEAARKAIAAAERGGPHGR